MQIDLSELKRATEAVVPWEFSVAIGGVSYATRPLKLYELELLNRLATASDGEAVLFVASLFRDGAPPADALGGDMAGAVLVAVVTYLQEWSKKKSLALAARVRAELTRPSTSASSSPPS